MTHMILLIIAPVRIVLILKVSHPQAMLILSVLSLNPIVYNHVL